MLYNYKAIDKNGAIQEGSIDAANADIAISSLQRRELVVSDLKPVTEKKTFAILTPFFSGVPQKDIVTFSQQVATLFGSQVSALKIFRLLSDETENVTLKKALLDISDRLQGGSSIANAFSKHPNIFTSFYVNMIKAGEESGQISETFAYLADYLDRTYEITSKTRNALIYPAFIVATFIAVMGLMFTVVIPKIGAIIMDSGQPIPIYTKIVFGVSSFFLSYGILLVLVLIAAIIVFLYYIRTEQGRIGFDKFKLSIPIIGSLYKKLYYSQISDNMSTMIKSGVPIVRSLEIASDIVNNAVYKSALIRSVDIVKGGKPTSFAFEEQKIFPNIMIAMVKVGEETGELREILDKLSAFYKREVLAAVDTLISLIEPVMIVFLGLSVGFLLASVLVPIYSISTAGF